MQFKPVSMKRFLKYGKADTQSFSLHSLSYIRRSKTYTQHYINISDNFLKSTSAYRMPTVNCPIWGLDFYRFSSWPLKAASCLHSQQCTCLGSGDNRQAGSKKTRFTPHKDLIIAVTCPLLLLEIWRDDMILFYKLHCSPNGSHTLQNSQAHWDTGPQKKKHYWLILKLFIF